MRQKQSVRCLLMVISVLKLVAGPPGQPTLNVLIYDRTHIGSKTLAQAERLATEIFRNAGVQTQWTEGSLSDGVDLTNDFSAGTQTCAQPLALARVRAQILPHAPLGFSPHALGYALPCTGHGMQVTIYADRVESVSRNTLASFYRVLAHALAHELGHVLLRSQAHEATGLMKGIWSRTDWQRAAVTTVPFTPAQANRVRQSLQRVEAGDTASLGSAPSTAISPVSP